MTWKERINNYHTETGFPESLFLAGDGRAVGVWIMGNDYRVKSGYYGGYPATYLKRLRAVFPDKKKVLHLFSGCVDLKLLPGKTVDINPNRGADYVDDAEVMSLVPIEEFDLIAADPPYSCEDSVNYGTPMISRNKVIEVLSRRINPECHIAWLDQVLPMYRKSELRVEATIGIHKSTNHRYRHLVIFGKALSDDNSTPNQTPHPAPGSQSDNHLTSTAGDGAGVGGR